MSTVVKYHQLLGQISDANPFKKSLIPKAFDVASDYSKDMQIVAANAELSDAGRQKAAQRHLRRAIRDHRDVQAPFHQYRAETERMRGQIKRPAFDRCSGPNYANSRGKKLTKGHFGACTFDLPQGMSRSVDGWSKRYAITPVNRLS
jgi:hypothetical protein